MQEKDKSMTPSEPSPIAITFGKRLRAWRRKKSYAIHAVAEDLKVSKQIVSEWERGVRFPCQKHLAAIAVYTQVPVCTFFREGPCRCYPDTPCE